MVNETNKSPYVLNLHASWLKSLNNAFSTSNITKTGRTKIFLKKAMYSAILTLSIGSMLGFETKTISNSATKFRYWKYRPMLAKSYLSFERLVRSLKLRPSQFFSSDFSSLTIGNLQVDRNVLYTKRHNFCEHAVVISSFCFVMFGYKNYGKIAVFHFLVIMRLCCVRIQQILKC